MSQSSLNPGQHLALGLIRYYQKYWSPDHSHRKAMYPHGYCRFYPTCSQYGYEAIEKKGLVRGSVLTIFRILRCNPLSPGGFDPVK